MEDPKPIPTPTADPRSRSSRSERLQLLASLVGAAATLLASGSAIAGGDHRKVILVTFAAGVALAVGAVVKYRRATRLRRPGDPPAA